MKALLISVVVVLLAAAPGYAGLITFDSITSGTAVTNQFGSTDGALFSLVVPADGTGNAGTANNPPIAIQALFVLTSPPLTGTPAVLEVKFVDPSNTSIPGVVDGTQITFDVWDTEATVNITAFDLVGTSLGTVNLGGSTTPVSFGASTFSGLVHRLEFTDVGSDGHVIDNLFAPTVTAVPEPGTFALLGIGLLGVSALRRRRNRS